MGRYTFPAFNNAPTPRYVVMWDMHWLCSSASALEPAADHARSHGGHHRALNRLIQGEAAVRALYVDQRQPLPPPATGLHLCDQSQSLPAARTP
jgi:hypothetical protein